MGIMRFFRFNNVTYCNQFTDIMHRFAYCFKNVKDMHIKICYIENDSKVEEIKRGKVVNIGVDIDKEFQYNLVINESGSKVSAHYNFEMKMIDEENKRPVYIDSSFHFIKDIEISYEFEDDSYKKYID